MPAYTKLASELLSKTVLKPHEGQKVDPAHPAIYPTGNRPEKSLAVGERNIFDLVVHRFLAVFGEPAIHQSIKAVISINGNHFGLSGARTLNDGWIQVLQTLYAIKRYHLCRY